MPIVLSLLPSRFWTTFLLAKARRSAEVVKTNLLTTSAALGGRDGGGVYVHMRVWWLWLGVVGVCGCVGMLWWWAGGTGGGCVVGGAGGLPMF